MSLSILTGVGIPEVKRELAGLLTDGIRSPAVRDLAESIVWNRTDHIMAVYNFVKKTFPYLPDPYGRERFVSPNRVAEDYFSGKVRQLDCDDFSLLTASLLGSIGYKTKIILLDTKGEGLDHAIAAMYSVEIEDWVWLDTTSPMPLGWEYDYYGSEDINPQVG